MNSEEDNGGEPLGGVGVASLMKALCLGINTYMRTQAAESSSEMNGSCHKVAGSIAVEDSPPRRLSSSAVPAIRVPLMIIK